MFDSRANASALLHSVFGFNAFRPGQEEIVRRRAGGRERAGRHADRQRQVAVLPASGHRPARPHPGGVAADRPDARPGARAHAPRASRPAASIPATSRPRTARVLGLLRRRELRLLYVAPERLARPDTVEMLAESDVAHDGDRRGALRLAMGPRFPPRVSQRWATCARQIGGRLQTLALTATADAPTRGDIVDKLFAAPPRVFVRSFDRPEPAARLQAQGALLAPGARLRAQATRPRAASSIAPRAARSRSWPRR